MHLIICTFFLFHFNSIKVRLKPLYLQLIQLILEFQFHKGTIKTVERRTVVRHLHQISIP